MKSVRQHFKKLLASLENPKTIMVHEIGKTGDYSISVNSFSLFIDAFERYFSRKHGKRLLLTFDDGYESVYKIAYPLLKTKKISFVCFLISDFVNTNGYLKDWQIKEMISSGLCNLGAHGKTHALLPSLSVEESFLEMKICKDVLSERFGAKINDFAYSHGQYGDKDVKILKELGFKRAYLASYEFHFLHSSFLKPRLKLCQQSINQLSFFLKKTGYSNGKKSI